MISFREMSAYKNWMLAYDYCSSLYKYQMRLHEIQPAKPIKPAKPLTPDQQRIATMKANAKRADQAVKAERARQQQRTAQQALVKAEQPIATV